MQPPAFPATPESRRNNGLDTLRAVAIILVFMYHYMVFVSHEPTGPCA
jgi:peptidoglycan/LPS O-acetylase OafA/YrhL